MKPDKPLQITKEMVWRAYQAISKNGKAAGVDGQSLDDFSRDPLYQQRSPLVSKKPPGGATDEQ